MAAAAAWGGSAGRAEAAGLEGLQARGPGEEGPALAGEGEGPALPPGAATMESFFDWLDRELAGCMDDGGELDVDALNEKILVNCQAHDIAAEVVSRAQMMYRSIKAGDDRRAQRLLQSVEPEDMAGFGYEFLRYSAEVDGQELEAAWNGGQTWEVVRMKDSGSIHQQALATQLMERERARMPAAEGAKFDREVQLAELDIKDVKSVMRCFEQKAPRDLVHMLCSAKPAVRLLAAQGISTLSTWGMGEQVAAAVGAKQVHEVVAEIEGGPRPLAGSGPLMQSFLKEVQARRVPAYVGIIGLLAKYKPQKLRAIAKKERVVAALDHVLVGGSGPEKKLVLAILVQMAASDEPLWKAIKESAVPASFGAICLKPENLLELKNEAEFLRTALDHPGPHKAMSEKVRKGIEDVMREDLRRQMKDISAKRTLETSREAPVTAPAGGQGYAPKP